MSLAEIIHHQDIIDYPIKHINFGNIHNLILYIENNGSNKESNVTGLFYIGSKDGQSESDSVRYCDEIPPPSRYIYSISIHIDT